MKLKKRSISEVGLLPLQKSLFLTLALLVFGTFSVYSQATVQFTSATYSDDENSGGNQPVLVVNGTVSTLGGSAFVSVFALGSGTAAASVDYTFSTSQVAIPDGVHSNLTIPIPNFTIIGDTAVESDETVNFILFSPIDINLGVQTTTSYFILNDDSATITIANAAAAENVVGGNLNFSATLNNPVQGGVQVGYGFTDGSATGGGVDYTSTAGTLTFTGNAGEVQNVVVPITNDNIVEAAENFTVSLGTPNNANVSTSGSPATGTINNDDSSTLTITNVTVAEDNGAGNLIFTVTLGNAVDGGVNVGYSFTDGTATGGGVDYSASSGTLSFDGTAGETEQITVNINNDNLVEADETFTVNLGPPSNGNVTLSGSPATGTITNDDVCAGGPNAPVLNNDPTAFCGENETSLDDYFDGNEPPDTDLEWSSNPNPLIFGDWIDNSGGHRVTQSGTYYGFFWDEDNNCASPTVAITITFSFTPSAGTPSDGNACIDGAFGPTTVDLDDLLTGADGGTWAQTGGPATVNPNGANVVNFNNGVEGVYEYTYTTNVAVAPCVNQSSVVEITVTECDPCVAGNVAPVLDTDIPTTFCDDITQSLNDYTNSTPPAGTTLVWSTNPDPLILSGHLSGSQVTDPTAGTYFGFFYDAVNICASPTLEILLAVNNTPVITSTTEGERCGPGTVILMAEGDIPGSGSDPDINWFTSIDSDTPIFTGTSFESPAIAQTTSYFVEATANGCTSTPRIELIATVVPQPSSGIPSNTSSCSVAENGPTTVDLDDQLEGEDEGVWTFISGPEDVPRDANNVVDFIGRPDGNYVFRYTTTGAMAPCDNEFSEVTISVNDCDVDTDMDGLFDGPEAVLNTDPNNPDTDGDGLLDGAEVGPDVDNPLDEDGDGIIDALDSNVLDSDNDGVVDQKDPANDNPCIPDNSNQLCDTDGDGITDGDEIADGTDPLDACDPNFTPDCDTPIDLEITKTADNELASVGQQVVFTIGVNNLSNRPVRGIKVGDLLESGFEYVSHETSLGSYDFETTEWNIFELEPLASAELRITVTILEGGAYTNTAQLLESSPFDDNSANNTATITISVDVPDGIDLEIVKKAVSSRPLIGDAVVFTIVVTNKSTSEEGNLISNIQVRDIITDDGGFEYLSHSPLDQYNPVSGIWDVPDLQRNQEAMLEITVRVPQEGTFTNTATIIRSSPGDSEDKRDNNESIVEVQVNLPTQADPGFVFNQFSPNSDGTNDYLKIRDIAAFQGASIQIFNRYGNLVFETTNMVQDEVWDGTRKNEQVPDGTYYYILDLGDGSEVRKGWIQLIR